MTNKHKNYSADEKAKIALEALKGDMTQAEISSKFGVHTTQIYKWKKQLESNIASIFKDNSAKERSESQLIDELYGKIGKLNVELDWLKKNQNYSPEIKRQLIDDGHPEISVSRQCDLLGLQRSTYYYKPVDIDILTQELLNIIDEYYTLHPEFGTRTMCNYLKSIGYDVNRKRIQNLYKTLGIQAIYTKPRTTIINKQHEKYPYLLDRIQVVRKDQAWCTDITYIRMKRGFMYLVAIMDWYSRYILSWQLSPFLEADFCIEALKEALQISSCEIFNSDQGSQFTSKDFTKILKSNNITISMAGKGRCYDNIFIERFWRTLKHNWIYLNEFNSVTELKDGLNYWIKFYNNERVHQALAYATPYSIYNK